MESDEKLVEMKSITVNFDVRDPEFSYEQVVEALDNQLMPMIIALCAGNQTQGAKMLKLNRGTYRKKLKAYEDMLKNEHPDQ